MSRHKCLYCAPADTTRWLAWGVTAAGIAFAAGLVIGGIQ